MFTQTDGSLDPLLGVDAFTSCLLQLHQTTFLNSTPQPFLNLNKKMVFEDIIQQKISQLLWGLSPVFSESVVATSQRSEALLYKDIKL